MTTVKEIMTMDPVVMSKQKGVKNLVKILAKDEVSCVIITDNNKVVGIITERDLIKKLLVPEKKLSSVKLDSIITKKVVSVDPDASLIEAGHVMQKYNIRHLPVIDNNKLRGLVTQADLARESGILESKNKSYSTYWNIQSMIITVFFVFLAAYLLFLFYKNYVI